LDPCATLRYMSSGMAEIAGVDIAGVGYVRSTSTRRNFTGKPFHSHIEL